MSPANNQSSRPHKGYKQVSRSGTTAIEQRLQEVLNGAQCPHLLHLLPKWLKQDLLLRLPGSFDIKRGKKLTMSDDEFSKLEDCLNRELNQTNIGLGTNGHQVSLARFFKLMPLLMQLERRCQRRPFRNSEEIARTISEKFQLKKAYKQAKEALNELCIYCGLIFSWPETRLVSIAPGWKQGMADPNFKGLFFVVDECYSEQQQFNLGGVTRPAFRLGVSCRNGQVSWLQINQSLFENIPFDDQIGLPVYIQRHATKRMIQRLDILDRQYFYLHLILALQSQRAFRYQQKTLIELAIFGQKAGYLVPTITDGKILIKTFLLLSDHGTPEGDRAHELLGRHQIDMTPWNTDRLSTFTNSSLTRERKPKSLVINAGCRSLFCIQPAHAAQADSQLRSLVLNQLMITHNQGAHTPKKAIP